jgi:hypothetical protein
MLAQNALNIATWRVHVNYEAPRREEKRPVALEPEISLEPPVLV